jgi:hypothetical protein
VKSKYGLCFKYILPLWLFRKKGILFVTLKFKINET